MGNGSSSSSSPGLLDQQQHSSVGYSSIGEQDTDNLSLNDDNTDLFEFTTPRKRRLALGSILMCQLFAWVAFTIVTFWIPQTLELNALFFSGDHTDGAGYYHYMRRVQKIPVLGLILLYSSALVAGILMDAWLRKTRFLFVSMILVCIAFAFIVAIILSLSSHIKCEPGASNATNSSCAIEEFTLCGSRHEGGAYCLDIYTALVCAVAVLGSVIRTALPVLGGDQIPERNGVRNFYAEFYWFQKLGEIGSASLCLAYLYKWNTFNERTDSDKARQIQHITSDYRFLFYSWGISISVASGLSLICLIVLVCGGLARQVNPDFSVIRDTWSMWWQVHQRRREKEPDDGCLDLAKRSRGGDFADPAVEERVDMAKFGLVLLLLVPVAFSTTLPTLPVNSEQRHTTTKSQMDAAFDQCLVTLMLSLARYTAAIISIPVIHYICTLMNRRGRPVALLHRFAAGYITMIISISVMMITRHFEDSYTVKACLPYMLLLGLCNALIYTAGYELTMISAPRAMQGTAMGMFYLMDGIANILTFVTIAYIEPGDSLHYYVNGLGGVAPMILGLVLLILLEKKYNLGLSRT